jgi:hypothetical protein
LNEFLLQPRLFGATRSAELLDVLDDMWDRVPMDDPGTIYIVSGFGSFNGGVPFFERLRAHVSAGGQVRAIFGASRGTNMTSRQLVDALLDCGAEVAVINRRYLMHAKVYGQARPSGSQDLVVTSGNFTGPGIARNIEAVLRLDPPTTAAMGFEWEGVFDSLLTSGLDVFPLNGAASDDPRWALLYDETSRESRRPAPEDDEDVFDSLIITLGHSDTVRIMADYGTTAAKGTQYFWLSKDSFAFFPPLTIRNEKGNKATYSCLIDVNYVDLGEAAEARVTFEAENNRDFRLGTSRLRNTKIAAKDDIAVLSRRSQNRYDLRIVKPGTDAYFALSAHATMFIGAQGKRYGYASNEIVDRILSGD